MPIVLLGLGLVLVLALSSKSSSAGGGAVAAATPCGPMPPLVPTANGAWRPYCPERGGGLALNPYPTSSVLGERVVLFLQEGVRAADDNYNVAEIEATNVGGDAITGYSFRLDKVVNDFPASKEPGTTVLPPPVGTVFTGVRPAFIANVLAAGGGTTLPVTPPKPPPAVETAAQKAARKETRTKQLFEEGHSPAEISAIIATEFPGGGGAGGGVGGAGGNGYTRPRSYAQARAQGGGGYVGNVIPIGYGRRSA